MSWSQLKYWLKLWRLHHNCKSLVVFSVDEINYHLSWLNEEKALDLTDICRSLLSQELGARNTFRNAVELLKVDNAGQDKR